jgi:general secretion pathway protein H
MRNRKYSLSWPGKKNGFTLIEIMVVIFIIGITISMVSLAVNNRPELAKNEADRLNALLKLAMEEAILNSSDLAVQFSADQYFFEFLDNTNKWQPIKEDPQFRPRTITEGLKIKLFIEGEPIDFQSSEFKDDPEAQPPRIYLLSSGEIIPFEILMKDSYQEDLQYSIIGEYPGNISMSEVLQE